MNRILLAAASILALGIGTARAQLTISVPNASSTGTTLNALAKLTGAPSTAVKAGTSDTFVEGIVYSGAGTTGNALIARAGEASCIFDGATTAGDYVQISTTTAGDCHDAGSTLPTSGQVLGRVLSTNGSGGTYPMTVQTGTLGSAGGFPALSNIFGGIGASYPAGRFYGPPWMFASNVCVITANDAYAMPWIATAGGTVQNLSFDITTISTSASWNATLAIYSDHLGSPGTLLTQTASTGFTSSSTGAQTVSLSSPLAITAGTLYWVVFVSDTTSSAKLNGLATGVNTGGDLLHQEVWGTGTAARAFSSNYQDNGWFIAVGSYALPATNASWSAPAGAATNPPYIALGF